MLLADSIEAWGRAKRAEMSREELEELGTVWRTIKTSPFADLDFRSMGKDDARAVMALFDQSRRAGVSQTLNAVRKWALAQPGQADQPDAGHAAAGERPAPVTPSSTPLPGTETVVMRAPTPAPTPAAPPPAVAAAPGALDAGGPVAGSPGFAAAAMPGGSQPGDPLSHGPVEGWQPPDTAATPPSNQNGKIIAAIVGALVVLLVIWLVFLRDDDDAQPVTTTDGAAATGTDPAQSAGGAGSITAGSDAAGTSESGTATASDSGVPSFDGDNSGDFCTVARQLEENDPLSDTAIDSFGPEFFAEAISLFERLQAIAPGEIQGDIGTLVAQFRQLDSLAAQYDYNFFDPELGQALSTLDTSAGDAASDRIDAYLSQVCGIDTGAGDGSGLSGDGTTDTGAVPGFDDLDLTDEQVRQINEVFLAQFNLSPELAECLSRELGDLTAAASDPSILNEPVCGTTLFNVISGLTG
jgi:hypothetical protein